MSLFEKFVSGNCSREELDEVLKHFKSGHFSSEELGWMKKHWYSLETVAPELDDSIDFSSVLNKIHHDINIKESIDRKGRYISIPRFYLMAQVAAVVAVILLGSIGIWYAGREGAFVKEEFFTVSSIRGQSSKVLLSDNTEVWLNGQSSIVYSNRYGTKNRDLELIGEGFFQVARNDKTPFVVKINGVEITALGTGFNIDAYDRNDIVITLESGKVQINHKERNYILDAGQQAIVRKGTYYVNNVDTELFTSWRNGRLIFKSEMLQNITSQLEKLYDVKFVYETDTLRSYKYRGTIMLDHSILRTLELLELSTGIDYEIRGNSVILKK